LCKDARESKEPQGYRVVAPNQGFLIWNTELTVLLGKKFPLDEHNASKPNQITANAVKHLRLHPDRFTDFKNPKVSASAFNPLELLFKETLLPREQQPEINVDHFSTSFFSI